MIKFNSQSLKWRKTQAADLFYKSDLKNTEKISKLVKISSFKKPKKL